ncbi:MAG: NfeD family protein [Lachnospiraceae bacterium]
MPQMLFWLAATVVFLLIEWPTMSLTTIWFAGGSLVAGLLAVLGCPFSIQFAVFLVVSVALLLFTRPLAIKYLNTNRTRTNVDSLIGKEAVITETINNLKNTEVADIHGVTWTARTDSNLDTIEKDSIVVIERIDGVKLIVKKKKSYDDGKCWEQYGTVLFLFVSEKNKNKKILHTIIRTKNIKNKRRAKMRDLREEDFIIIVVVVCCTIIIGIGLVDSKIKTNQYNQSCELQNRGYTVYVNGLKNDEIRIRRLDPDDYRIRIDEDEKEIVLNKNEYN